MLDLGGGQRILGHEVAIVAAGFELLVRNLRWFQMVVLTTARRRAILIALQRCSKEQFTHERQRIS